MGVKQNIVIVNEFTYKPQGSSGTRGGTPGSYIQRYMARDNATENLAPVLLMQSAPYPVERHDHKSFIMKYMAREEAVEQLKTTEAVKSELKTDNMTGVAFGYGSIAMTRDQLRAASSDIQRLFDKGKTVMKTVVSFDEAYLRENGIVDDNFQFQSRGDYRGNIDQLKLRTAIMKGCDRLGRYYDDLRYVGVIQVDTAHVHCHLAMVDAGRGNLTKDGYQRGKISEAGKRAMRRGIDMSLDEAQAMHQLQSNVQFDRRHTLCYMKKFTHKVMEQHGLPQFLMACLPEDKRLWRAGSNAKAMRKPNAIVKEFVTEVLDQPDSGYKEALQAVDVYCKRRQEREGFDQETYRKLYDNGRNQIVADCMNGVYSILKEIPDKEKTIRTPMLDVMSEDYEQMALNASSDPMIEFGFRLRSYSSRLQHHKKETHRFHEAVENYKKTPDPDPSSTPLLLYLQFEEEYNAKLMCKYQHFLGFLPPGSKFEDEFEELSAYKRRCNKLREMTLDTNMRKMSAKEADKFGERAYGHRDGRLVSEAPHILEQRLERMQTKYDAMEDAFRRSLADDGLSLQQDDQGLLHVSREKPYSFDEVKALDIHHLGYDFAYDVLVSKRNIDAFTEAADTRYELYQNAMQYLRNSGQYAAVDTYPRKDVLAMKELADKMRETGVMKSELKDSAQYSERRSRTFSLDHDFEDNMRMAVKAAVQSVQEISR